MCVRACVRTFYLGKRQCISSCNCVDKMTSPVISEFSVLLNHQSRLLITFSGISFFFSHEYRVIEIFNVCIQTGSVRKGWKFSVAKWTELALYGIALCSMPKKKDACFDLRLTLYDFRKFCLLRDFNFLSVFNLMLHAFYMHAINWLKIRLKNDSPEKNVFLHFLP